MMVESVWAYEVLQRELKSAKYEQRSWYFLSGYHSYWFSERNRIILTFLRCSLVVFLSHYATCFHNWKCFWGKRKHQLLKVSHCLHLRNLCFLKRELIWCLPGASVFQGLPWMWAGEASCLHLLSSYKLLRHRDQVLPSFSSNLNIMVHSHWELDKEWLSVLRGTKELCPLSVTPPPPYFR